jgi:outer membrane immunogenic protein
VKRILVGVAAALAFTTGHAVAEGLAPPSRIAAPVPPPAAPKWSGFYVGAGIGAGLLSQSLSGEAEDDPNCNPILFAHHRRAAVLTPFSDSDRGDLGAFGTIAVGFDVALAPRWIGGVLADYDFGSSLSAGLAFPGYSASLDHASSWAIGARLGYLVTPSTLLYATGGYTQADLDAGPLGSKSFDGYFVGGGVETFLGQSWTLKLEYRFSQFAEETILDEPDIKADLEPSMHTARLVLSYKLGYGLGSAK